MVIQLLTYLAIILYLFMSYRLFTEWLGFFLEDEKMNSGQRLVSGLVLVIGSILWLLVVPFAYLELLKFHKKHKKTIDFLIKFPETKVYHKSVENP
jgi:hypothetical protein